jgi:hypothetical protein
VSFRSYCGIFGENMKSRVIIKRSKFIPQIKEYWWNRWSSIYKGCLYMPYHAVFDTLDEAIIEIRRYQEINKDNGKVVWQSDE